MSKLIERLDALLAAVDETGCEEVLVAHGWTDAAHELEMSYPKLRAVVLSAKRMKDMAAVGNDREAESACADLFEDLEVLEVEA